MSVKKGSSPEWTAYCEVRDTWNAYRDSAFGLLAEDKILTASTYATRHRRYVKKEVAFRTALHSYVLEKQLKRLRKQIMNLQHMAEDLNDEYGDILQRAKEGPDLGE